MSLSYAAEVISVSKELSELSKEMLSVTADLKQNPDLFKRVSTITSRLLDCTDRLNRATHLSVGA
jgi:hypothetical protein